MNSTLIWKITPIFSWCHKTSGHFYVRSCCFFHKPYWLRCLKPRILNQLKAPAHSPKTRHCSDFIVRANYLEYRFRRHPRMPIFLRTTRCVGGRHTARCEQFRRLTPSPPSPCWGETWGNWRTQCGLCTEARPGPSACPKRWQCGRPRRSRWWDDQPETHSLPTRRRDDPCIWKM